MARIRTIKPEFYGSQVAADWRGQHDVFMLYRFYAQDDALLYIGITCRPAERFTAHRRSAAWWAQIAKIRSERIDGLRAALAAEVAAIRTERPAFNRRSAA